MKEGDNMTKEQIGAILKEKRLSSGLTQKEVAKRLGRNQPIVGHWETGYAQPDANTLFLLCDIYGTTVDEAFGFQKNNDISKSEYEHIKKYRSLDPFGQETVSYILDREVSRMEQFQKRESPVIGFEEHHSTTPKRLISYYYKNASAGTGQLIIDNLPEEDIEIPDIPKYKNVSYAIGVNGSSMEPTYHDGNILLVEATREIQIGEIGIFQIDGECFVKKLGENLLVSLNPDYESIPLNESAGIMGRVIDILNK